MEMREIFKRALLEAAEKMVRDQGKNPVFAAPLAVRVLAHIKVLLTDEDISKIALKVGPFDKERLKLTGSFFGPFLYPDYGSERWQKMKFRDFLQAFPEIAKVHPGESGDMVQVQTISTQDPSELSEKYRTLLFHTLKEIAVRGSQGVMQASVTPIPINQLAIWMNRSDAAFNVARLGYSSFLEWLQKVPEVKIKEENGVIRVGPTSLEAMTNESATESINMPAYLLVDGSDLMSTMHEILGSKPMQSQLPDWGKVLQYCRDKWPKLDWRGRYFIAQTADEHISMEGFTHYLEAVGFKVRSLNFEDQGATFEESRLARNQITLRGLERALQLIRDEATPAVLLIASHSNIVKPILEDLLRKKETSCQVGMLGFPERMPRQLISLKSEGLFVVDLEHGCGAFKKPLKRSFGINVEDITAEDIL